MIKFEEYQESDKAYLWNTYIQAMKPHIKKIWGWENNWQKNDFAGKLAKYQTFILREVNTKIGYIQIENNPDNLYINMLILEPICQSKGFGKSILEQIISSNPYKKISLRCFKINLSAYSFYLREGFVVVDSDDDFYVLEKIK